MVLLNFSHPITEEQLQRIEELTGKKVTRVVAIDAQVDLYQPLSPQVAALADRAGLTPEEWQTLPILIVPPSLSSSTAVLLAELHGRCGYFPPVVRLRPVQGEIPPRYEVAEILDLQSVREEARRRR